MHQNSKKICKLHFASLKPSSKTTLKKNNILILGQFGLHSKHSTQYQRFWVVEFLSEKLISKVPTAAIFFHVTKSFDKVWHEDRLIHLKFPARLIQLIYSHLCDRTFRVRINNNLSAIFFVLAEISGGAFRDSAIQPTFLWHPTLSTYIPFTLCGRYRNLCIS